MSASIPENSISFLSPLEPRAEYGFNKLVDIPKHQTLNGISSQTHHPYCTYAEVSISRILRSGHWGFDFIVEQSEVEIAGVVYDIPLPVKQVNTKSGVLIINDVTFLVQEESRGPRCLVRPLYLNLEDDNLLRSVKSPDGSDRFPRITLSPEIFADMTIDMFGFRVNQQQLLGLQDQFRKGEVAVKIGDRFLNQRLIELSQLSYSLRINKGSVDETQVKLQSIYQEIITAGSNTIELLEYSTRVMKIRGFIEMNHGIAKSDSFITNTQLGEALYLLDIARDLPTLPFRMQYTLMTQLSGFNGGSPNLAKKLLDTFSSEENIARVRNWDYTSIILLCSMLAKNMNEILLLSLPESILEIIVSKNATYSFLGHLADNNHNHSNIRIIEARLSKINSR